MDPQNPSGTSDAAAMANIISNLPGAPAPAPPTPSPTPPAPEPRAIDFTQPPQVDLQPDNPTPPAPAQPTPVAGTDPNTIPLNAPAPAPADMPDWAKQLVEQNKQLAQALQAAQPPTPPATPPAPGAADTWSPENWQDVDARITAKAQELVQQGLTQAQAQAQAQATEADRQRQEADQYIDNQVSQLEATGYLPKIQNPADPNDPGREAHRELYAYALSQGTDKLTAVAPVLHTLHQNGYYFDRTKNALVRRGSQSAAAQAPIAGASPNVTGGNAKGPTMMDFATKDLATLAEMANQAFPLNG